MEVRIDHYMTFTFERANKFHLQEAGAIMFCVALTDYDQVLQEDPKANRMQESLSVSNSSKKSIYLIQNYY